MRNFLFVYITCANAAEARKIAGAVVAERLAACANIMAPHEAVYWWDGAVQKGDEVAVVMKTRAELFDRLKDRIVELHSYEVPCIVALPIEGGHAPFLDWIKDEVRG